LTVVQNFDCCWKFSIFGRNYWILEVLAHEKSDETPKKVEIFNFQGTMKGRINNTFSGWLMCKIVNVVGNFWIFDRNSWVLKVLAHEKSDEIQNNLISSIFMVWWRGLLIKLSQDDSCAYLWVLLEILNFLVEILEF
jgi:hypothetical protein